MKTTVAAIGNVNEVSTFSGIPYHFLKAAQEYGIASEGWPLAMERLKLNRVLWNVSLLLQGKKYGGFQYSEYFETLALKQLDTTLFSSRIISFNQFFPSPEKVLEHGGEVYYYIDATFNQLLDRYKVSKLLDARTINRALLKEQENLAGAKKIVAFQNWCKDSLIYEYNIDPSKVEVILPGANIVLPENFELKQNDESAEFDNREFVLGFVGKDWKRKGLPLLLKIKEILEQRGHNIKIKCAGFAPKELESEKNVEFVGFLDKKNDIETFCRFIQSCDLGCLFSEAEFSSISVLEFLRLGIPVAGYTVDGMGDLFLRGCSIKFDPKDSENYIANKLEEVIVNPDLYSKLKNNAVVNSTYVSWERCVKEWQEKVFSKND